MVHGLLVGFYHAANLTSSLGLLPLLFSHLFALVHYLAVLLSQLLNDLILGQLRLGWFSDHWPRRADPNRGALTLLQG